MQTSISLILSILALLTSIITAWMTLIRRGSIKMTRPTTIFLGPDTGKSDKEYNPKIYVKTLLFCTAKRGRVIENMYAKLFRNETAQKFNIWVFGDAKLARGSGLFVNETGISANHHFLTPADVRNYRFVSGEYTLVIYARLVGSNSDTELWREKLVLTKDDERLLENGTTGIFFDWGPDSRTYTSHAESPVHLQQRLETTNLANQNDNPANT